MFTKTASTTAAISLGFVPTILVAAITITIKLPMQAELLVLSSGASSPQYSWSLLHAIATERDSRKGCRKKFEDRIWIIPTKHKEPLSSSKDIRKTHKFMDSHINKTPSPMDSRSVSLPIMEMLKEILRITDSQWWGKRFIVHTHLDSSFL